MVHPPIQFWTPEEPPSALDDWDPDREPARFADGFGHSVLELYVRMRRAGYDVHLGRRLEAHRRVVVFLPSLLERRTQLGLVRELLRQRSVQLVAIRSDFLISYNLPIRPSLEVMPNRASLVAGNQTWIPPLPQRGLVPRDPRRGDAVERIVYKGYPENLPGQMAAPTWSDRLRVIGVSWAPDIRDAITGANMWHDFSDADVALCLRGGSGLGLLRKPATKLINAWSAGVIPFVGREPSYVELVRHREDAMIVESVDEVVTTLEELRSDPELVRRLRRGVASRGVQFSAPAVLDSWTAALSAPLPDVPVVTPAGVTAVARVAARFACDAARGDTRSPVWRPENER